MSRVYSEPRDRGDNHKTACAVNGTKPVHTWRQGARYEEIKEKCNCVLVAVFPAGLECSFVGKHSVRLLRN